MRWWIVMNSLAFDNTFIRQTLTECLSCSKHSARYWGSNWVSRNKRPIGCHWPVHLDSSKVCAAPPSTLQPHLGADPACICSPEKGWPHLSSSSRLICKTRIILTQFAALWWRINEKRSGLVLISSGPDGFYLLIPSVASFLRKLCIL